jgi:hypothetical protein
MATPEEVVQIPTLHECNRLANDTFNSLTLFGIVRKFQKSLKFPRAMCISKSFFVVSMVIAPEQLSKKVF